MQSGVPQPINYNGADTLGLGGGTSNRPNQVAAISYPKTRLAWFNKSAFAAPVAPWNGGPNQGWGNAKKRRSHSARAFQLQYGPLQNLLIHGKLEIPIPA